MTHHPCDWTVPPKILQIRSDQVHTWRAIIDRLLTQVDNFRALLNDEEQKRAQRFVFDKDRHCFIIARAMLRILLGRYLGARPQELCFSYNNYGKPELKDDITPIGFNLSHSNNMILMAFAAKRQVGVDVEYVRKDFAEMQIAERFFSPPEVTELLSLTEEQRTRAFFNCWTRKEAYIKAVGKGLSIPLDEFGVSIRPGEPAKLIFNKKDDRELTRWRMESLNPGDDYVGAVAVAGRDWGLKCWDWMNDIVEKAHFLKSQNT